MAPHIGVGPTVGTEGGFGVEARVGYGAGPGGDQTAVLLDGSVGGGVARNGEAGLLSGGVGPSGILVADSGPSGRLGLGFVGRRHFQGGSSIGFYGFGVQAAIYGALSGDSEDTFVDTPLGDLPTGTNRDFWMLGAGASLDWVWGSDAGFGTMWVPLLLEYWHFSSP